RRRRGCCAGVRLAATPARRTGPGARPTGAPARRLRALERAQPRMVERPPPGRDRAARVLPTFRVARCDPRPAALAARVAPAAPGGPCGGGGRPPGPPPPPGTGPWRLLG